MITLKNITKKFDNNLVLNKINLEINQGEIVGLLGPNGAGKTTTMRLITGFLNPTSGQILINNKNINDDRYAMQLKKQLGYLSENNPLYSEMLAFEYLYLVANIKQIDKAKINKLVKQAVKKTGIEKVYYKPISDLSKGYKQRVGLAASILGDPKILILDEPTEGLDPNQRVDIRNLIKNLGQNKTVIISSHVLSEIENTCDRIIIINKNKIIADGKTKDILASARGQQQLYLEIAGDQVKEKISQLVGEDNIKNLKQQDQRTKFIIEMKSNQEKRPEIFNLAKENNWVIWEMHQRETSLEDAFKELTK